MPFNNQARMKVTKGPIIKLLLLRIPFHSSDDINLCQHSTLRQSYLFCQNEASHVRFVWHAVFPLRSLDRMQQLEMFLNLSTHLPLFLFLFYLFVQYYFTCWRLCAQTTIPSPPSWPQQHSSYEIWRWLGAVFYPSKRSTRGSIIPAYTMNGRRFTTTQSDKRVSRPASDWLAAYSWNSCTNDCLPTVLLHHSPVAHFTRRHDKMNDGSCVRIFSWVFTCFQRPSKIRLPHLPHTARQREIDKRGPERSC